MNLVGNYIAAERSGKRFIVRFVGPAAAPVGIKPGDVVLIDTARIVATHGRFHVFPFSAIYAYPKDDEDDEPRNDQVARKETR
jgi:hypothetical protein